MWTIIGYVAAVLCTVSFVPQALKIIITKNTKGISLYMYIAFCLGVLLWSIYGFAQKNYAIAVSNLITTVFTFFITGFKIRNIIKNGEKP